MNEIVSLISTVGFPIVACIFVAVYTTKQTDNYRADIKEMQQQHKEEMQHVTEAVNNNTVVLQKLCDKLDDTKEGAA